jgi:hypothetical protein
LAKYYAEANSFCDKDIAISTENLRQKCDQELKNIQFWQSKLADKFDSYPRINDSDRSKRAIGPVALLGMGNAERYDLSLVEKK